MVEVTYYAHGALVQLHDDIKKLVDYTNKKKEKKNPVVVPLLEESNHLYTSYKKKVDEMRVELEKKKNENALDEPDCDDTISVGLNKCRISAPTKRQLENYNQGVKKLRKQKLKEKREQEKRRMHSMNIYRRRSIITERQLMWYIYGVERLRWKNGLNPSSSSSDLNYAFTVVEYGLHSGDDDDDDDDDDDVSVTIERTALRKVRVSNNINSSAYELELLE